MRTTHVTEPASTAAGAAAAWKFGLVHKLAALLAIGGIGGLLIAAFDPPKSRALLFGQAAVAGFMSLLLTPAALRALDYYAVWIDLSSPERWLEAALPAGFLIGAMSWGLMGALVKLRELIRVRAARSLAGKVGLK
jgi:hypothetical protein